jgi:hypothetical protein
MMLNIIIVLVGNYMQTFLPDENFIKCGVYLDDKRLWKQVLEADGILRILSRMANDRLVKYHRHPVVVAWIGSENFLLKYRDALIEMWFSRRLIQQPGLITREIVNLYYHNRLEEEPDWWKKNKKEIISQYRALLLYKNYDWYSKFGWKEEPNRTFDYSLFKV